MRKALVLVGVLAALLAGGLLPTAAQQYDGPRVALVLGAGGLGDRSINDMAFAGLTQAVAETGVEVMPLQGSEDERAAALSDVASTYDLVMTLDARHADLVARLAAQHPDTHFAIMDVIVDEPNVTSLWFDDHANAYLAGALAAYVTTSQEMELANSDSVVGAIVDESAPLTPVTLLGYVQGVCATAPETSIQVAAVSDAQAGVTALETMQADGVDVVLVAMPALGTDVFDQLEQVQMYAIGSYTDLDYLAPGYVLTSTLKPVDHAVRDVVVQFVAGDLEAAGVLDYTLAGGVMGLSDMTFTRYLLPADVMQQVSDLEAAIVAGDVTVVDARTLDEDVLAALGENPTCAGVERLLAR